MKRRLSIALGVVLLVAVIGVIVFDRDDETPTRDVVVRGVIGSEKLAFFRDERVREAFAAHGVTVEVDTAGSRQIATTVDLAGYDFVFPSSQPAAQRIQRDRNVTTAYTPFQSPMAVATFAPVVEVLERAGVIRDGLLDVGRYLELARAGTRWDELPGNTEFRARKSVLITTTDPRDSNSAAMYVAIASYVANGNAVVASQDAEARLLPELTGLFLRQGYAQSSSAGPFEDYLVAGMGRVPMALVYESQFLGRQVRGDGTIQPDMRLVYLAPTVYSEHTLVPLTDPGDEVGRLLTTDDRLGRLAAEFGFRTSDPGVFADVMAEHDLTAPDLVDVVEPPSFETLERLLDGIEARYS
ncbi:substrate-binding domain-containing protein [Actinophytocola gossypii]|uniref:Extracellular solute-binding protein n=1 Tax=Actinophytocola gossypii TaxID=2812003 RepID=A0ABT2J742_9PSEU|nr:substrate-binding domain-containing protein [Actinophytocola gossypii]MCT2583682.1 hypothetical protein [Actinophytocola gossypii]